MSDIQSIGHTINVKSWKLVEPDRYSEYKITPPSLPQKMRITNFLENVPGQRFPSRLVVN